MNFTICLTVSTKMSRETVLSMLINIIHTKYVDKYYTYHPNVPKFCSLINMTSKSKNINLAKFISCILWLFNSETQLKKK